MVQVVPEGDRGLGLRAMQDIPEGTSLRWEGCLTMVSPSAMPRFPPAPICVQERQIEIKVTYGDPVRDRVGLNSCRRFLGLGFS